MGASGRGSTPFLVHAGCSDVGRQVTGLDEGLQAGGDQGVLSLVCGCRGVEPSEGVAGIVCSHCDVIRRHCSGLQFQPFVEEPVVSGCEAATLELAQLLR